MRRIPIHFKLAAALILPVIALVGVTGLEIMQSTQEASEVRDEVSLVRAATGPGGLFNAIQDERNRTGIDLIGQNNLIRLACPDNESCRAETDQALQQFRSEIDREGSAAQAAYAPAFEQLDRLDELRAEVDAQPPPYTIETYREYALEVFGRYTDIVDALLEANAQVTVQIDDPQLRRGADMAYLASREVDLIARLVSRLLNIVGEGANAQGIHLDDSQEWTDIGGLWHIVDQDHKEIIAMATGPYARIGEKLEVESDNTGLRLQVMPAILQTGRINLSDVLAAVSIDRDQSYYGFRDDVREIVDAKADDLSADAVRRVRVFQLVAAVVIVVAFGAMIIVSLSITRPLRTLTKQATDMANQKLPDAVLDILDTPLGEDVTIPHVDPVRVLTRDEVADVAEALNTVQDSALDLAVEQAVLRRNIADSFVNLGRRNQNLLGRQLDFITELEHNETDPDTLSNLFRLDHLATRMRRNAESLLVLAGIDPPRKWAAPVKITDVIRAALGEVEDYQRVTVRAVEPATIMGSVAADLAHLMAELVENALIFSPPDQHVEVRGRLQPSGPNAVPGYTLAIIDSGLGMPPEELARANRRLAGAESFTIAPSKYLGHYVAGNLAARHNINVQLHNSPGHGITATINLPPPLLTTDSTVADTAPGAPELQAVGAASALAAPASPGAPFGSFAPPSAPGAPPGPTRPSRPSAPAAGSPASGHTASGLAKRPRRADGLDTGRPGSPPVLPDNELIETLAQYTGQPADAEPAGVGEPVGVTRGTPLSPATGTPALSHLPPFPVTPPGGNPAWPSPRSPLRRDTLPPQPTTRPSRPQQPSQVSGQTASGLARRVRGAQLPNTDPVSLRRGGTGTGGPTGRSDRRGPRPPAPGGASPEASGRGGGAAKDVYGFLSDFTAGVQRGLDESGQHPRQSGEPPEPPGDGQ